MLSCSCCRWPLAPAGPSRTHPPCLVPEVGSRSDWHATAASGSRDQIEIGSAQPRGHPRHTEACCGPQQGGQHVGLSGLACAPRSEIAVHRLNFIEAGLFALWKSQTPWLPGLQGPQALVGVQPAIPATWCGLPGPPAGVPARNVLRPSLAGCPRSPTGLCAIWAGAPRPCQFGGPGGHPQRPALRRASFPALRPASAAASGHFPALMAAVLAAW